MGSLVGLKSLVICWSVGVAKKSSLRYSLKSCQVAKPQECLFATGQPTRSSLNNLVFLSLLLTFVNGIVLRGRIIYNLDNPLPPRMDFKHYPRQKSFPTQIHHLIIFTLHAGPVPWERWILQLQKDLIEQFQTWLVPAHSNSGDVWQESDLCYTTFPSWKLEVSPGAQLWGCGNSSTHFGRNVECTRMLWLFQQVLVQIVHY